MVFKNIVFKKKMKAKIIVARSFNTQISKIESNVMTISMLWKKYAGQEDLQKEAQYPTI